MSSSPRDMGQDAPRTRCIRCGQCCITSSPTLHIQDLHLIESDLLRKNRLYTIRKGEMVRDPVKGALTKAREEMIKIKEKSGMGDGCLFYDGQKKACRIYEKRPAQCASLKCWDTRDFMAVYERPKLRRKDVIHDGVLLGLIESHEDRCGYSKVEDSVTRIRREGEKAVERLIDLMKFDFNLRPFVSQKLDINQDEMGFCFGRPLTETISMYGLKVTQEPDGSFFLTKA
ncbi:MAG: YkgJ family cysteine cluster protein [Deltaproteobacteria bacterium]|nr:YkgJ family cysteine cluster protein [Deltaproteobacteria bacterium]